METNHENETGERLAGVNGSAKAPAELSELVVNLKSSTNSDQKRYRRIKRRNLGFSRRKRRRTRLEREFPKLPVGEEVAKPTTTLPKVTKLSEAIGNKSCLRMENRIRLQKRRQLLEQDIAKDAARHKVRQSRKTTPSRTFASNSVDRFAQLADDELNVNLMEPEIVIETQDECFVEYNMESSSVSTMEPRKLLHFLSANSDFDPSIANERATTPQDLPQNLALHQKQKSHEVRIPSLAALVKVPVGKILCNFGHVIEQARKLERHTLRCGLGGEMVYHMTLKTGSVYEAIYRCSQPNCAVRMTIESDFHDKVAT